MGPVDGLEFVQSVTASPDGKHLYAAGSDDNAVAVFSAASADVSSATPIPSVSHWGLISMAGMMAALLLWQRRRAARRWGS